MKLFDRRLEFRSFTFQVLVARLNAANLKTKQKNAKCCKQRKAIYNIELT